MKIHVKALHVLTLVVFLLVGCNGNVPPEEIVRTAALNTAKTDEVTGLVVDKLARENGWQDTHAVNRYWVRHNYSLKLSRDFPEAVLGLAKELFQDLLAADKGRQAKGFFGGAGDLQTLINYRFTANQFAAADGFAARRDALLSRCKECLEFFNDDSGGEGYGNYRRISYIVAWNYLSNDLKFPDSAKAGDSVARQVTNKFLKTEKGWMPEQ